MRIYGLWCLRVWRCVPDCGCKVWYTNASHSGWKEKEIGNLFATGWGFAGGIPEESWPWSETEAKGGSRTLHPTQTVLGNTVCTRDLMLFLSGFCSAAKEVSWVNCLVNLFQTESPVSLPQCPIGLMAFREWFALRRGSLGYPLCLETSLAKLWPLERSRLVCKGMCDYVHTGEYRWCWEKKGSWNELSGILAQSWCRVKPKQRNMQLWLSDSKPQQKGLMKSLSGCKLCAVISVEITQVVCLLLSRGVRYLK